MRIKTAFALLCALALVALFQLPAARSQDDIVQIQSDAFETYKRSAAVFAHDAHNEKAALEDCETCHHGAENGKRVEGADSVGTPCADCHEVRPATGTGLMQAYHKQCKGCHAERAQGPRACGECHVKETM